MRCISRTATIAAHQQFVPGAQTFINQARCPSDFLLKVPQRFQSTD
jgi:hypothetical protein